MKTLKKLFSVSAIVALLGTLAPMYAFGATYTAELEEAYNYAHKNGITTMSSIDNANMFGTLTRIAMAKMIANYATTVLGLEADTSAKCTFSDVTAALDAQYDNGVTNACQLGLMGQNITAFRPNDPVTRGEFGTTLSRALNRAAGTTIEEGTPYYENHLKYLKDNKIMNDISNPNMNEVRGYVMLMMMRADDSYEPATEGCTAEELLACVTADDYDACIAACSGEEEEPEVLPGYATVSTKAAASQTVALNAVEKKIGTVTLKAGDNDTTVTALEITKSGLGDPDDIIGIQLMKDGEYVSNLATSLTSKKTATLRFSPKLEIKAGKSETFDVVVSLSGSNANGQHDFSVTAVTVANGTFGGTPAKLGSLVTTNYTVSNVTAKLGNNYNLNAGDENKEMAKVTLTPKVEALITSVTLTASGADELNKKFDNVKAYIDDEVVGTVTVNDETITIDGLKETVKANKSIDIVLKGDVIYVGSDLTAGAGAFDLTVESNHVTATETNTNERMTSSCTTLNNIAIVGLDLSLKNLQKQAQTVAPESTDVVLMNLEMVAGADLEIENFELEATNFDTGRFEEGKATLYIDGIDYPITAKKTTFSQKKDYFSVSAGDKVSIQVVGDLSDTADFSSVAFTFKVTQVKNLETNNKIGPFVKSQKGHVTTVKGGKPTLKDTKVNSSSLVKEGETSEVLGFSVKANNEQLTVKSATFTVNNLTSVKEIALYKEGTTSAIVTKDDDDSDWATTMDFTFSQTINADATTKFVLKATMDDGTVTTLGTNVVFGLTNIKYTTASSGATQTLTATPAISASYQLAAEEPTFTITKNGNRIEVVATNNSDYDIDGVALVVKVIGEFVDGTDLLKAALVDTPAWTLKDDNDNIVSAPAAATYDSGKNLVTVTYPLTIESHDSAEFAIEMPESTTIRSEYYTAQERVFGFRYVDTNGFASAEIKAKYNGAAISELGAKAIPTQTAALLIEGGSGTLAALLGSETLADLQSGVVVTAGNRIEGELKPYYNYTAWSSTEAGTTGHYLVLHAIDSAVTQIYINDNTTGILDGDKVVILKVENTSDKVHVVKGTETVEYDMASLILK